MSLQQLMALYMFGNVTLEKSGYRNNNMHSYLSSSLKDHIKIYQRDLSGHIGDVNICKFFPSGLVVVSGAADLRMKIWSAEDGSCPVTLIGHTSGR